MNLLETQHLLITADQRTLCRHLTLTIRAGETWGILGPNGCGKTTLLHTLAGLRPAASGNIQLRGKALSSFTPKQRAKQIALLFQEQPLTFPQTVWQYCLTSRYPFHAYFEQANINDYQIVEAALEATTLLPLRENNILTLSGGEKRRLAIAAVLAQTPAIYLLDEPVNHLDIRQQMRILTHFQTLVTDSQTAVVMTLHDINLTQPFCTHLLLMHPDGRLIHGKTAEVLNADNLSALYGCSIQPAAHHQTFFWPA